MFARRPPLLAALALLLFICCACSGAGSRSRPAADPVSGSWRTPANVAFLDSLQHRTFRWFWELSDSARGLTPDRWPTRSFVSVGAMGFALTAYPIGAEHGWITRSQARDRTLATFEFLWTAPQDSSEHPTGYRGFYYHFLVPETGRRFEHVELSTMDTALLLGGVLFCQSYFDRRDAKEARLRALADSIVDRVDWTWATRRPPTIVLGWSPEEGHLPYDWRGYNEAMLLNVLALGSRTHPADPSLWSAWCSNYKWGTFEGEEHLGFAPLFGHQYSQLWIDYRGIQDPFMRSHGIDYFENSRRATRAQRAYAIRNPGGWKGYDANVWGLTACDGPMDSTVTIDGRARQFHSYEARGASHVRIEDDGTLAPTAAGGSIAFTPEISIAALRAMRARYGADLYGEYGFFDCFNPTLSDPAIPARYGRLVPGKGWFDTDYLGIDQGPIVGMIENLRSDLVWKTMRKNPNVVRGLRRAGFRGGWLDPAPGSP